MYIYIYIEKDINTYKQGYRGGHIRREKETNPVKTQRQERQAKTFAVAAAHTIDLMLEDIGKSPLVDQTIVKGRAVTVFLYAHTRVLALMRKFLGKDLVWSCITRFATAYLNLKSLQDNKKELQKLFRGSA